MPDDADQELTTGTDSAGRSVRVLVVDDNEGDYVLVKSLLDYIPLVDYDVRWLPGGEGVSERIADIQPDICLVDYNLTGDTGLDLISSITRMYPLLPSVLLTGESDPMIDVAAMRAGAADFIEKSRFDARVLDRTIRRMQPDIEAQPLFEKGKAPHAALIARLIDRQIVQRECLWHRDRVLCLPHPVSFGFLWG